MDGPDLTQEEADYLLGLAKRPVESRVWTYPSSGQRLTIPLQSAASREAFLLDIYRGRINVAKGSYQNRVRVVIPLARLDFGGAMHTNPDGARVPCPHLHIYTQGYGLRWAYELPTEKFGTGREKWQLLDAFMDYCNITDKPQIQGVI